jgi:hypothetical protein
MRYGGMGWVIRKRNVRPPGASSPSGVSGSALITARSSRGTVMRAAYVCRMPGLSWVGIHVRVRIACPCEYRYGCDLPAVCDGASHCSAAASGDVR